MANPRRKKRKAINEPGHAHFLTFSCRNRWPLLSKDRSRKWAIDALKSAREKRNFALLAYVIMPEHAHVLILPREARYEMRQILAAIKAPVSRQAKLFLLEAANQAWLERLMVHKGGRSTFQFWQAGGGYDANLCNERAIEEVIDYIHANPVRRGLVERPTDWYWSSAGNYAGLRNDPIEVDRIPF